jgi:hypothetical protein
MPRWKRGLISIKLVLLKEADKARIYRKADREAKLRS